MHRHQLLIAGLMAIVLLTAGCTGASSPGGAAQAFAQAILDGEREQALDMLVNRNGEPVEGAERELYGSIVNLAGSVDTSQVVVEVENVNEVSDKKAQVTLNIHPKASEDAGVLRDAAARLLQIQPTLTVMKVSSSDSDVLSGIAGQWKVVKTW